MIEQQTTVWISSSSNTKQDAFFSTNHKHGNVLSNSMIDWFWGKLQTLFKTHSNNLSPSYFTSCFRSCDQILYSQKETGKLLIGYTRTYF